MSIATDVMSQDLDLIDLIGVLQAESVKEIENYEREETTFIFEDDSSVTVDPCGVVG